MKKLSVILFSCLCFLASCANPNIKNQTIPQVDSSYKLETEMSVSSTKGWQNSGIVLQKGQKVIIRASGLWNKGFAPDCGPDGYIGSAGEVRYNSQYGAMSLLGKIGNEKEFLIGSYLSMEAGSTGELSFRSNCADIGFWDNAGGVTASIFLPKSYDAKERPPSLKYTQNTQQNYQNDKSGSFTGTVFGTSWAIIIGISDYKDTRIPSLRYASADAKSFYNWATSPDGGKYAPSRVKLLIDQDATGRNIKNALFIWLKQALQEDIVTIYFAGHGSPESPDSPSNLFLLPYDTKYDEIASSGFPMWDIETALKRYIKAKKVVVIADACHSGGVGQSFDVARRASRAVDVNPISSGLQNLSQIGDGVCVISASDDKQFSQESKDWGGGHGVFTFFLLEGLKGNADYNKDSNVTLGELIPYLSEKVRRATKNAQAPTVAGKFDPALSIGR